jgi:DNA polymerase I
MKITDCSLSATLSPCFIKPSDGISPSDEFVQTTIQAPISDKKVAQILGTYVAFDFEWSDGNVVEAASFVDNNGTWEVKFKDKDFGDSERDFLNYIMDKIQNYHYSIGWHTQGNSETAGSDVPPDLRVLYERCHANGIDSIVKLGYKGLPYVSKGYKHIDLYNIYSNPIVAGGMYKKKYRDLHLNTVANGLLGHGKYNNHTGADFDILPPEEKIQYSRIDSQLVIELSQYHDFEALDAFYAISEITSLEFDRVCQTKIATWWGSIYQKDGYEPTQNKFTESYKGADVVIPKQGKYVNIIVVDAQSLYPTVAIKYNLSFDTVNCPCCKYNSDAKLTKFIPKEFLTDCICVNSDETWICQQKRGAFPQKLKIFKEERITQKKLGNNSKQYALKILINGGYGVFGNEHFKYYDPRVAELVTAAGRYMLFEMQSTANDVYGFEIIYGDTDSLFLNNTNERGLKEFQQKFLKENDIDLEIKNKYDKLILSAGKKHYIGVEKGQIDIVGFEGIKDDRPGFYHQVYEQLVKDILEDDKDPLVNISQAFNTIGSLSDHELLKVSRVLGKEPADYKGNNQLAQIGKAIGAKSGEAVWHYHANKKKTGNSWTLDFAQADIQHYKQLLWNTVDEILDSRLSS